MEIPRTRPVINAMTMQTVEEVEDIERACFSSPWSLDSLVEELSNPLAVFRTAELDGKIVGYAGMHHIIDEGYITNIAVLPDYRRQGIARALMESIFEYAEENELKMVTLEVRESNAAAQAMYESMEFEKTGMRKRFYTLPTEDCIIMTREL